MSKKPKPHTPKKPTDAQEACSVMKDAVSQIHYMGNEALRLREMANNLIESIKGYEAATTLAMTYIKRAATKPTAGKGRGKSLQAKEPKRG